MLLVRIVSGGRGGSEEGGVGEWGRELKVRGEG